jgi:hypothetical protein
VLSQHVAFLSIFQTTVDLKHVHGYGKPRQM